jgi:predicted HTH domain antitoxin
MTTKALPLDLQEEVTALTETGLYANEESVLADALRTLLGARPDLRVAAACRLYDKGRFSLGKAAEWSGLSIEAIKEELHRRGIHRGTEEEPEAVEAMAKAAAKLAGRPQPGW